MQPLWEIENKKEVEGESFEMMYQEVIIAMSLVLFSIWDIKKRAIPTVFVLAGLLLAIAYGISECVWGQKHWLWIFEGILPGLGMLIVAWVTRMAGYGDGMVLLALGILYGYKICFFLLCVSLFLLAIFSAILLVAGKVKRNTRIPYIPFLSLACLLNWTVDFT